MLALGKMGFYHAWDKGYSRPDTFASRGRPGRKAKGTWGRKLSHNLRILGVDFVGRSGKRSNV